MKQQFFSILPLLLGSVVAGPVQVREVKREVPQEHSHEAILIKIDELLGLNNPNQIQAAVFGLLGAAAASEGAGLIEDAGTLLVWLTKVESADIFSRLSPASNS